MEHEVLNKGNWQSGQYLRIETGGLKWRTAAKPATRIEHGRLYGSSKLANQGATSVVAPYRGSM